MVAMMLGQGGLSAGGSLLTEELPDAPPLVTWTFGVLALVAGAGALALALWVALSDRLAEWWAGPEDEWTPPPLAEVVAESLEDLRTELAEAPLDLGAALLHLGLNGEALGHLVLLGHLEADDELLAVRLAVERVTGRIRTAVLQRHEHRGHLLTDLACPPTMNQSCNSTHALVPFAVSGPHRLQGR